MAKISMNMTGGRIRDMKFIYNVLYELLDQNIEGLEYDYVFKEVVKRSRGHINPNIVKRELDILIGAHFLK